MITITSIRNTNKSMQTLKALEHIFVHHDKCRTALKIVRAFIVREVLERENADGHGRENTCSQKEKNYD